MQPCLSEGAAATPSTEDICHAAHPRTAIQRPGISGLLARHVRTAPLNLVNFKTPEGRQQLVGEIEVSQ